MAMIKGDTLDAQDILCFLGWHQGAWGERIRETTNVVDGKGKLKYKVTNDIQRFSCGHCGIVNTRATS